MLSMYQMLCLCCISFIWLQCIRGVATDISTTDEEVNKAILGMPFAVIFFYPAQCESADCQLTKEKVTQLGDALVAIDIPVISLPTAVTSGRKSPKPQLLFYRHSVPITVDVALDDTSEVISWIEQNKDSYVVSLDDFRFEHETQAATGATTGDWFVHFYTPECTELVPVWEAVASRLHRRLNVASVNLTSSPGLQKRFHIKSCPSVIFFRHGKMYTYDLPVRDVLSYVSFAEGWYDNAPMKVVPKEPTPFDNLVQTIVDLIKENMSGDDMPVRHYTALAVGVAVVFIVAVIVARRISGSGLKTD